jgi:hypothetical protein
MIKKEIKFYDFEDHEVTETHYFHLTKIEILEWNKEAGGANGGLQKVLEDIQASKDPLEVISLIGEIIQRSYGRKDPNSPTNFIKDETEQKIFVKSLQGEALLSDLLNSPETLFDFVYGIIPRDLRDTPDIRNAMAEARKVAGLELPAIETTPDPGATVPSLDKEEEDRATGLQHPRTASGELVPWAFRKPTGKELTGMSQVQRVDVTRRANSGWIPAAS